MKTSNSAKAAAKPARLLVMAIHYAYLNGGGEHYPLNLARTIRERYEAEFLCCRGPFWWPRPLSGKEFKVHFVPGLYVFRNWGERFGGRFGLALRVIHYGIYVTGAWTYLMARGRRFRLVNTHDVISLQAAVWARRLTGLKVVATLHGRPDALEIRLLRSVDRIISVNALFKDDLEAAGITNVDVIPTGYDPAIFHPGDKAEARKALGLQVDAKILLYVGRMIPIKNVGHLLQAFVRVREKLPDARLILVGKGSYKEGFERQAAELGLGGTARFRGAVAQEELCRYYNAADTFILPSLKEAFPMVGVEALASGVPVLMTTASPGFKDFFPIPTVGSVDPKDVGQTAGRIIDFLAKDHSRNLGRQLDAVQNYTWEHKGAETEAVFDAVVAGRGA